MTIALKLPYPPSLNRMYRSGLRNACKACRNPITGAKPFMYLSSEAEAYQTQVMGVLERLGRPLILQPADVAITAHFYRPQRSGDLDNFFKGLLDVMSGHAGYEDDSQIAELHAYRHDTRPERPGVEVVITDLSRQGKLL